MGVTSNQKVSAGRKVYLFVGRARRNEAACRVSRRDEPRSNGSACRPRGSRRGYQLTPPAASKAHRPGTARISWSETRCDPESFSLACRIAIHRGKLPFFRWLALSNANRAGRIAFANCVCDWKKLWLAMQMRAAGYVIQLVILIL